MTERRRVLTMLHEHKISIEEAEGLLDALEQTIEQTAEPEVEIITANPRLQQRLDIARRAGSSNAPVLIVGEPGSGKELIARLIHQQSLRRNGNFIYVNCALLPETLLESELFGHERGAFTGAIHQKIGLAERGNGGTLFFDEISNLPMGIQMRLLRFIDTGNFQRCGNTVLTSADVRIIAATSKDLKAEAEAGSFHRALLDRLNVIKLEVPPLRERAEDIPLLIDYFLKKSAKQYNKAVPSITPEAMSVLVSYQWPGNARELYNVIQGALVMCRGDVIQAGDLPDALMKSNDALPF